MKILYLATDVFSKGGIPRYSRYQINALRELYGENNIFVFSLHKPKENNLFDDNFKVSYIQGGIRFRDKIFFSKKSLIFAKNNSIDLIINNHLQLSSISFIAKNLFKIRYLTNVYGLEVWSGFGYKDKVGLLNSDAIIGDCNFILNYIEKHFSYSKEHMHLLYDPVDIKKFIPLDKKSSLMRKYKIPFDKFILMTIGRLDRDKGFKLVINALRDLPSDIVYVVVGDGKDRKEFEYLVNTNNLSDRVIFTGRVPEVELVDFYNICDLFVLISRFGKGEGEGLPLALIEASACEKPIIVGNEDGSSEAVEEGKNGFIISPADMKRFIDNVLLLYNNKELRVTLGKYGRIKVMRDFNYENFKSKLRDIIDVYRKS